MGAISYYPSLLYWPDLLCRDRSVKWALGGRTISGGKTLSGFNQVARLDGGGLWTAELSDVQVSTADQVRAWHGLQAIFDGGVTPVVMTNRMTYTAPYGTETRDLTAACDDGALCSDGAGFLSEPIRASVVSAAALRATTLTIDITVGGALRGGEYFSIEHPTHSHRLYQVGTVTVNDDGDSVVVIRPPLREAVTAGTTVNFANPKCVMQVADPNQMDLSLSLRMYGQTTVRFIESFPPWS